MSEGRVKEKHKFVRARGRLPEFCINDDIRIRWHLSTSPVESREQIFWQSEYDAYSPALGENWMFFQTASSLRS